MTPCSLGGRERLLDQRLDVVEALVGGRASTSAERPPSAQCARATRAASSADLDPRRDRRPAARGVEERQLVGAEAEHRHAERLEQLRGRGTSSSDLTPERDDERLRPRELAEVRRDVQALGQPRCTPPIPPVAMKPIPAARQAASVPPTVVAPTAPWATQAREVARPDLARLGGEAARARPP